MSQIDYTSQEFWAKAPEGATHYLPKCSWYGNEACWYIIQDYNMAVMLAGVADVWGWRTIDLEDRRNLIPRAIPRPAERTTWDGTGLPPVGTECEVDYEGWTRCEIIAHFQQRCAMVAAFTIDVVGNGAKTLDAFGAGHFRPLRTPEQLAAEEREKAINEMWMCIYEETPQHTALLKKACADLYDAGYRRISSDN